MASTCEERHVKTTLYANRQSDCDLFGGGVRSRMHVGARSTRARCCGAHALCPSAPHAASRVCVRPPGSTLCVLTRLHALFDPATCPPVSQRSPRALHPFAQAPPPIFKRKRHARSPPPGQHSHMYVCTLPKAAANPLAPPRRVRPSTNSSLPRTLAPGPCTLRLAELWYLSASSAPATPPLPL